MSQGVNNPQRMLPSEASRAYIQSLLQNRTNPPTSTAAPAASGQGQGAPAAPTAPQSQRTSQTDAVSISTGAQGTSSNADNSVKMTAVAWEPGQPSDTKSSLSGMLMSAGYSKEELFAKDPETGKTLIDKVAESNGLKNPNLIMVGDELSIPKKKIAAEEAAQSGGAATAESTGSQATDAQRTEAREMRDAVHERASDRDMMDAMDTLRNKDNARALGALAGGDSNRMGAGDHFTGRDLDMAGIAHRKQLTNDIVIDGDRVDWHATGESMRSKMGGGLVDVNLASTQMKRVYDALPDNLSPEQRVARMEEIFKAATEFDTSNAALEGRIKRNGSGRGFSADQIQEAYVERFSRFQQRIEADNRANESITRAETVINLANETPAAEEASAA